MIRHFKKVSKRKEREREREKERERTERDEYVDREKMERLCIISTPL